MMMVAPRKPYPVTIKPVAKDSRLNIAKSITKPGSKTSIISSYLTLTRESRSCGRLLQNEIMRGGETTFFFFVKERISKAPVGCFAPIIHQEVSFALYGEQSDWPVLSAHANGTPRVCRDERNNEPPVSHFIPPFFARTKPTELICFIFTLFFWF